ncbi:M24 family metallopeptidase [Candidatus Saccharibacteria bacterium]|nr:M24 family metallopeptidase [Candidatus Saccharibacteria bacterium]
MKTKDSSARRTRINKIIESTNGGLVVFTGYNQMQYSADMAAPFLQEGNFWWTTGIDAPGWRVIIDGVRKKVTLVRPDLSEIQKLFDGGLSDESALQSSDADEIIRAADFESYIRSLQRTHSAVYTITTAPSYDFVVNPAQHDLRAMLGRVFPSVLDCSTVMASLRAIKTEDEIIVMKQAAKLTTQAFSHIAQNFANYHYEYEIEADFTHIFRRQNAQHAYEPIVAADKNATILHYTMNNAKIKKNAMILIDVGARVNGYVADVTRTYAVSPTFRQKQVHHAVETAQRRIIKTIAPHVSLVEYQTKVDEIMKDALEGLGLLKDRLDSETYRKYFPHAISHGLGVDVHDSLGRPKMFLPGMVITVEPGIYISEEGIGVRIEDDILVTETGHHNLTSAISTSLLT